MSKAPKRGAGRKSLTPAEKEARKEALKNESKDAKFTRLGLPRMNKALNAIRQLGNLSSAQYAYNDDMIAKMRKALDDQIDETFARFTKGGTKEKQAFAFS